MAAAAAATPRPVVVIVTEARTPIRLWLPTLLRLRTPCGLGSAVRALATRASERRASILVRRNFCRCGWRCGTAVRGRTEHAYLAAAPDGRSGGADAKETRSIAKGGAKKKCLTR